MSEILSIDPCHKFAWCLDACVRERHVDRKRARELQGGCGGGGSGGSGGGGSGGSGGSGGCIRYGCGRV